MRLRLKPTPIFFMHVPKTGGTAIAQWLKSVYRAQDFLHLGVPELADLPAKSLARYRCYHSGAHFGYSILAMIQRYDLAVCTVLREPIERCVSSYYQLRRALLRNPHAFRPDYVARMLDKLPEDIADVDRDFLSEILTTQTTVLGARRDYEGFFEDLRRRRAIHGRSVFLRPHVVAHVPGTENPQHTFERAVAWLHSMSVVGLTERFEETQQLMADLIGVPPPRQSLIANVNPSRNDLRQTYRAAIAPEMLAYLEEINHYDLALYAVAVDLFEQKWVHFRKGS